MRSKNVLAWALALAAVMGSAHGQDCDKYKDCASCAGDGSCAWVSKVDCTQGCLPKSLKPPGIEDMNLESVRNSTDDPLKCDETYFGCKNEGVFKDPSFESHKEEPTDNGGVRYKLLQWTEERRLGIRNKTGREEMGDHKMFPAQGEFFMYFGGHKYEEKYQKDGEPSHFYQYQIRHKNTIIPTTATHLSFFLNIRNLNNGDKFMLTILIDQNPIFSITEAIATKYLRDEEKEGSYSTALDNRYIEVDITQNEKIKGGFADGLSHQFVINYMVYFENSDESTVNGVGIDYIQFIRRNYTGETQVHNVSNAGETCSRWCPPTFNKEDEYICRLGCINCYNDWHTNCNFYGDTDSTNIKPIIIIIIVVGVLVAVIILAAIVGVLVVKLRRKRMARRAAAVSAYDSKAEDNCDDWGFNKQSLAFNQTDDEINDGGNVLMDMVTLTNKEYDSITVTLKLPKNEKYEVMTKESKLTLKNGASVKVKFMLRIYCSVNISDQIIAEVKASGNNAKSAQPKKLSVVFNGHVDRIDPSQLVKGEPVGEGSFGTVYKGSCGGIPVVIKSVRRNTSKALNNYAKNIQTFVDVSSNSNFLVKLFGISETTDMLNIVTEFVPLGSVDKAFRSPSKELKIKALWDISRGMESLHARNVIHGDLKPGNVFCVDNSDPRVEINCKVSDFGEAGFIAGNGVKDASIPYAAPEVLNKSSRYNKKIDTYSFGVTAIEILSETKPFSDSNLSGQKLAKHIIGGGRPSIPDWCSAELSNLIRRCLDASPKIRPSFSEITKILETELLKINPDALSLCTEPPAYYDNDEDDDDNGNDARASSSSSSKAKPGEIEMNIIDSGSSGNNNNNSGMNQMMMSGGMNPSMNQMMMSGGMNPSMNQMMMSGGMNPGMNQMMMSGGMNGMMMTGGMNNMMMSGGMNGMMMTGGMNNMMMSGGMNGMNNGMMMTGGMNNMNSGMMMN